MFSINPERLPHFDRRLTEAEYGTLGEMMRAASENPKYEMTVKIIRQIAITGRRRSEMIGLKRAEAGIDPSCIRSKKSKESTSADRLCAGSQVPQGCAVALPAFS